MQAVDALLMTSITEGSPQVIKEAMACGCPIVSVDVGDVKERIAGIGGCRIVERDPASIAKAVKDCLCFQGKTVGRQRIEKDCLWGSQIAERIIAIYKCVVSNHVSQ